MILMGSLREKKNGNFNSVHSIQHIVEREKGSIESFLKRAPDDGMGVENRRGKTRKVTWGKEKRREG